MFRDTACPDSTQEPRQRPEWKVLSCAILIQLSTQTTELLSARFTSQTLLLSLIIQDTQALIAGCDC